MSDLIDRQALREDVEKIYKYDCQTFVVHYPQVIDDLSSIEPEQKKGKWIDGMLYHDFDESEWEKVKCSVCKNFVIKQIFYYDNKYHYCPNCGAKMENE